MNQLPFLLFLLSLVFKTFCLNAKKVKKQKSEKRKILFLSIKRLFFVLHFKTTLKFSFFSLPLPRLSFDFLSLLSSFWLTYNFYFFPRLMILVFANLSAFSLLILFFPSSSPVNWYKRVNKQKLRWSWQVTNSLNRT